MTTEHARRVTLILFLIVRPDEASREGKERLDGEVKVTTPTPRLARTWEESLALGAPSLRYWQVASAACQEVSE